MTLTLTIQSFRRVHAFATKGIITAINNDPIIAVAAQQPVLARGNRISGIRVGGGVGAVDEVITGSAGQIIVAGLAV
nr:hypothetical protein [Microvirga arabica]